MGDPASRPFWRRPTWWARRLVAIIVGYLLLCLAAMALEDHLIYLPDVYPDGDWERPAALGLAIEELRFVTTDGVELHGWLARSGEDDPWLLFCHGNAGNITHRSDNVQQLVGEHLNVLIFDYRGYGRSAGKPSEEGLYRDAEAALAHLTGPLGVPPARVVIFGRSLGGGVATELAVRHPEAAGLILESTFRSIPHIGQRQFPFLPVHWLVRTRFDNLAKMARLPYRLLLIHGTADQLIPFEEGKALVAAANSAGKPVELHPVEGGGHNDTWIRGGSDYLRAIGRFCHEVTAAGGASADAPE